MNKKLIIILAAVLAIAGWSRESLKASPQGNTPAYGMFYKANELFREKKYEQAKEQYEQILALGMESGNLYYNIGNAYFKMGMLGEALSSYARAKRLIPNDSDLKANIAFLESLRENPVLESRPGWIVSLLKYMGSYFSAELLTYLLAGIYWLLLMLIIARVLLPRYRSGLNHYIVFIGLFFLLTGSVWGIKIYDRHSRTYAFVVDPVIDVKFAPADEATTYFKVYEGTRVTVIREEGKWVRVKTPDGKIGWASRLSLNKV